MKKNPLQSGIHYAYQLEMGRFLALLAVFGGAGVFLMYWGSGLPLMGTVVCVGMGLVCWLCMGLVLFSFFKQKEIILEEEQFSCPHQSPLRMFQTIVVNYENIRNIQKISHAGKAYIMVQHSAGDLYIGEGMLADTQKLEEIHYWLFYKLGVELNG
jgi:hypothetical protein